MLKLGVNIDHVATIREARYRGKVVGEPDPIQAAVVCLAAGAHGITAHLREDRRHMLDRDIIALRQIIKTRFNFEMANTPEIVDFAIQIKPDIVCLVPEKREEVTTEGGLDVVGTATDLSMTIRRIQDAGIQVSLFIDPDPEQIRASAKVGAQFVELHTGAYAEGFHNPASRSCELNRLGDGARLAHEVGLRVNAGHGLNYDNVRSLFVVPYLEELNIGHSIISRAVFSGLERAVKDMLSCMEGYAGVQK